MLTAKESPQKNVPFWVQSPYSKFEYNVEPMLRLFSHHGALEFPQETAKEIDEAIIGLTCSSYCPEPVLTAIRHLTLIRQLLDSIEVR